MQSLITSFLLLQKECFEKSKECNLPGIGALQIIHTPAIADVSGNRILSPSEEIIFKNDFHSASSGLVKYIADKKQIGQSEAEDLLNNFCKEWKERMNAGEKMNLETLGSIQKNADGFLFFERKKIFNYWQPVSVDEVYQKAAEHASINAEPVLQQTNVVEKKIVFRKPFWKIWALILFTIAVVTLFYYFNTHTFSGSSVGNQHHFIIDTATATYSLPNK